MDSPKLSKVISSALFPKALAASPKSVRAETIAPGATGVAFSAWLIAILTVLITPSVFFNVDLTVKNKSNKVLKPVKATVVLSKKEPTLFKSFTRLFLCSNIDCNSSLGGQVPLINLSLRLVKGVKAFPSKVRI